MMNEALINNMSANELVHCAGFDCSYSGRTKYLLCVLEDQLEDYKELFQGLEKVQKEVEAVNSTNKSLKAKIVGLDRDQEKLIRNSIYRGAIKAGAEKKAAKDHAAKGLADFREGKFNPRNLKKKSVNSYDLIEQRIFLAIQPQQSQKK